MSEKDKQVGKRFSHVYITRGKPQNDSARFRKRLSAHYNRFLRKYCDADLVSTIERELGVEVPIIGIGYCVDEFIERAELHDLLDSITLIWRIAKNYGWHDNWFKFVERALKEENLGYKLDEQCGVHFFVDQEFESNRLLTLSCLNDPKYTAVATSFKESHKKLDSDPSDTKSAIRAIFEAVEILYKLLVNAEGKSRLNSKGIRENLKPIVQTIYKSDSTACTAAEHLLDGLCNWIDAAHMYRHGQKVEESINPPIEVAIQMLSLGATYLRWLVEFDSKE